MTIDEIIAMVMDPIGPDDIDYAHVRDLCDEIRVLRCRLAAHQPAASDREEVPYDCEVGIPLRDDKPVEPPQMFSGGIVWDKPLEDVACDVIATRRDHDERRFRAAVAAMQGLIAAGVCTQKTHYADGSVSEPWPVRNLARAACLRGDVLLAELAKEKS